VFCRDVGNMLPLEVERLEQAELWNRKSGQRT
jgi:hypothetical protein